MSLIQHAPLYVAVSESTVVVASVTLNDVTSDQVAGGGLKRLEDALTKAADLWQEQEARNTMHAQVYVGVRPE